MIYFIEAIGTNRVKIGRANNIERRLDTLQVGCPHELRLLHSQAGDAEKERDLHEKFEEYRTIGEWFELCDEIREYIENGWQADVAEWREGLPVLFGRTAGPRFGKFRRECHLICKCPKCARELVHGFRPGEDWLDSSHRVSHCQCHDGGYFIAASRDLSVHEFDPRESLAVARVLA